MEGNTEIAEDLTEKAPMDPRSESTMAKKMFMAQDMLQIAESFRNADIDETGLDIEQFCVVMQQTHTALTKDRLTALHMQIDTNCLGKVKFIDLLNFFLIARNKAPELKNQVFRKPVKMIPMDGKTVVRLLFYPFEEDKKPNQDWKLSGAETRTYQRGQYLSISSGGTLNFWSDRFDRSSTIQLNKLHQSLPFSHIKKMCVRDMVYLKEIRELAIATSNRELLFYCCNEFPDTFEISHSLIEDENMMHAINYWSDGTKAVLSCGDAEGFLYVFISNDVQTNGLFCSEAFEKISLQEYPTVCVSKLLQNPSEDFLCVKLHLFHDICSEIRYFPDLESFAVCSLSSQKMVLTALPKESRNKFSNTVFNSREKEFFTCVDYSPIARRLVTGGTDGLLRVWFPHKTRSCEKKLKGHVKPITHIECNHEDSLMVTLSEDKIVCVWSQDDWLCMQSFQAQDFGEAPISSMCYNTHNNELLLANSFIGKHLGRGAQVFKDTTKSHNKPLCCALYHSFFKQVVSVSQNGVVKVWDLLTAKIVTQFRVTPDEHNGFIAMTFDEPQRRLITVSLDGKVRLWNFNNGKELMVHPITVHREVTSVVCRRNRVFVSGKNSKVIFDLDLKGHDNRFLEHACLNDISSMVVHKDQLIATSSKGNTVIWNVNTAKVLFWLNTSKSPRTKMADKSDQGRTGKLHPKSKRTDIHKNSRKKPEVNISPLVICLKTREINADTATLLKSADGYIEAWSVINKGGLLAKFKAVNAEGAVITTMSTNVNEQILLTGDSTGKVCLWNIQGFGFKNQTNNGPFENIKGWKVSLLRPPRLRSWRSHLTGVVSVKCDPACENIITAGLDCTVRLWTNTGRCVCIFGTDQGDITQFSSEEYADDDEEERPESSRSSSPLPDFKDLHQRILEATYSEGEEILEECEDIVDKLEQILHENLQSFKDTSISSPQPESPTTSNDMLLRRAAKYSDPTPCPSNTLPGKERSDLAPNRLRLPPISERVQLTHKSQLETHPPPNLLIRDGTDLKQSSPQPASPYLNQTTSKYGRVLNIQQRDTMKGSDLIPCPPNTLPGKERSDLAPNPLRFPPISERVQLTHKSQLETHPPPNLLIRDGTDLKQSSPQPASPYLNQTTSKYGRVLNIQQRDTMKGSDLIPCPPNTLPGKERSDLAPNRLRFPPISERVQLTHKSQLETHPPPNLLIRDGADLKQSSPQPASPYLNQTTSKYGRVLNIQQRDTMKGSDLIPCPPNTLPGKERSDLAPNRLRLPPISDRVQLTHKSQLETHPPPNLLIRDGTDLKQSSPQPASPYLNQTTSKYGRVLNIQQRDTMKGSDLIPCPPNTLPGKERSDLAPNPLRFPPISERVQLTHKSQLETHPPPNLLIRDGADLKQSSPQPASPYLNQTTSKYGRVLNIQQRDTMKGSDLIPCPPNTLPGKERSDLAPNRLRLPPISDRVQLTHNQSET